jgi:hypothetical protein
MQNRPKAPHEYVMALRFGLLDLHLPKRRVVPLQRSLQFENLLEKVRGVRCLV